MILNNPGGVQQPRGGSAMWRAMIVKPRGGFSSFPVFSCAHPKWPDFGVHIGQIESCKFEIPVVFGGVKMALFEKGPFFEMSRLFPSYV